MTDNARKFLVFVSKSYTLRHAMKDAKDPEAMLKLAKDNGFDLTAEDFESSEMEEMSEDEMRAVAGGSAMTCKRWVTSMNMTLCATAHPVQETGLSLTQQEGEAAPAKALAWASACSRSKLCEVHVALINGAAFFEPQF